MNKRKMTDKFLPEFNNQNFRYDVYIYHHPANTNEKVKDWERKSRTKDQRRALLKAKSLRDSDKYQKVEIKRCKLDSDKNCTQSSTYRVYDSAERGRNNVMLFGFICAAMVVAAGAIYLF